MTAAPQAERAQQDREPRVAGFFALTVSRPIALFVLFMTLVVIGLIAYTRIPLRLMPAGLTNPGLEVNVVNPGASAVENSEQVARVIEEQVRTLTGIERVSSGAHDDGCWVYVRYQNDVDMNVAKAELRDRLERARTQLPDTVEEVFIWSRSMDSMPVMFFALLHPGDSDQTDYLVEEVIQRRLEAVDGVGKVDIYGLLADSVRILLDEERVKELRLNIGELVQRLARDNFAKPLGEIEDGGRQFLLRSDMRFTSIEEIERYPIGNGMTIGDVGRVERVKTVRDRLSRIDGSYSYFGSIQKDSAANEVETSHRLKAALEELERDPALAGQFEFRVLFAQGDMIEDSLAQMRSTAVFGGALAVLILFVFLRRIRLTLCVALSIPVSCLLAITWTFFTGGTFNVLTMTGVTLAIGMLVDNSVVVVENIARLRASGRTGYTAAVQGARDVGLAVALATMTTVVVFLPLIFMGEDPRMRLLLGALGIPMCVALVASLFIALVFLPVIAARIVGPRPKPVEAVARVLAPVAALPYRLFAVVLAGLRAVLHGALFLAHRTLRGTLAVLTPLRWPLALGLVAFAAWRAGTLFAAYAPLETLRDFNGVPKAEAAGGAGAVVSSLLLPAVLGVGLLLFGLKRWRARPPAPPRRPASFFPGGRSFVDLLVSANRSVVGWALEHRVFACLVALIVLASVQIPIGNMEVGSFGQDENRGVLRVRVDLEDNFTLREVSDEMQRYEDLLEERREEFGFRALVCNFGVGWGRLDMYFEEQQTDERLTSMRKTLREALPAYPGHQIRFYDDENTQATSSDRSIVRFQLRGPDYEELMRLGEEAVELLRAVPGLEDVSSPLETSPEQVRVQIDSEVAYGFGIDANTALQNISWALRGFSLPRYQEAGREVPFYMEYDNERLAGLDTLRELDIFAEGNAVPLTSFARVEFAAGTRSIYREDGQCAFTITGRVDNPIIAGRVSELGYEALRTMELPRGYSLGEDQSLRSQSEEDMAALKAAALLGMVLVFLLMGILFESFILPFSVLFTIPFAIVGAYWTLFLTGTTMDSIGWIGIIILIGVVVNNGIVLIDRIHRLRISGMERSAAVLEGASNRVRPILMTAMTTVGGLLPMVLSEGSSEGIDYRALATCLSGGLALSTLFTVWVVPLAYTLMDDLGAAVGRRAAWSVGAPGRGAARVRRRWRPGTARG